MYFSLKNKTNKKRKKELKKELKIKPLKKLFHLCWFSKGLQKVQQQQQQQKIQYQMKITFLTYKNDCVHKTA